jgi:hypothetical protein
MSPRLVMWSRLVGLLPVVDYAIAMPVSLLSPVAALVIDLLVPAAYVGGLLYRLLYRLSR